MGELILMRMLEFSRSKVFDCWELEENFVQWWGPDGFQTTIRKFDFTPGGVIHYSVKSSDSQEYGRFEMREIDIDNKVVFIKSFSNENADLVPAPVALFGKNWPLELVHELTFEEQDADYTLMRMRVVPRGESPAEIEAFNQGLEAFRTMYDQSFDRLQALLEKPHYDE